AFNINEVQLTNISGGTMSPTVFPISPAISYQQTSGVLTTSINGPLPGQQICFTLTVHEKDQNGNELFCCTHSQTYCFTMPDWPVACDCGPDPFTLLYGVGHGPLLPRNCGDTLIVPDIPNLPIQFYPSFQCIGLNCPPATVTYTLTGPAGFVPIGPITVAATPGFSTGLTNATFTLPGTYMLNMLGHCGQKECPCKLTFIVPKKDTCCVSYEQFCQNVENVVSLSVDHDNCKAKLNIGNLLACDEIRSINWGDGATAQGPFTAGAMPMHTYAGSGTYAISYSAVEYDYSTTPPKLCFEKVLRDTIRLDCDTPQVSDCCAYELNFINLHTDGRIKKVRVSPLCDTKICCADPDDWAQNFDSQTYVEWFPADGSAVPTGAAIDNDFILFLDKNVAQHDFQVEWFDQSGIVVCRHNLSLNCNGMYSDDEDWLIYTHTTPLNDPNLLVFAVREPDADEEITDCDEDQEERAGCPEIVYQVLCNGGSSYFVQLFGSPIFNEFTWKQESGPFVTLSNPSALGPYFTATQSGSYVFSLTEKLENVGTCSLDVEIIIPDIVPDFVAQQLPCGTNVQFTPTGWGDPSDIKQITWICTECIGGTLCFTPVTTPGATGFVHTFPVPQSPNQPDCYKIKMVMEDKFGCFHEKEQTVIVDITCKPSFKISYALCACPLNSTAMPVVTFTNTSTGGVCPGTTWTWNFGDGSPTQTTDETQLTITHKYNVNCPSQTYTVTLKMNSPAPVLCSVTATQPVTFTACNVAINSIQVCPDGKHIFEANVPGEWDFPGALEIGPWPYSDKPDINGRRRKVAVIYPAGNFLVTFKGYCGDNGPCVINRELLVKVDCYTKNEKVKAKDKDTANNPPEWKIKYQLKQRQAGGHKIKSRTVFKARKHKSGYSYLKRALAAQIETYFSGQVYKSNCTVGCNYDTPDNTSGNSGIVYNAKKAKAQDALNDKYRSWMNSIKSTHRVLINASDTPPGYEYYLWLGSKCKKPKWHCPAH
ncbi:MAG: hypothetical protein ACKVU2_02900, partial [Saprospiraceae bacterium]